MGPKPSQPQSGELFRPRLDEQLNMKHPLVRLAALRFYCARFGLSMQALIAALLIAPGDRRSVWG